MTKTTVGPVRPDNPCDDRPLLTPAAAAARLGITRRSLAALRRRGVGPSYIRLSLATIRYLSDDLNCRRH